MLIVEEAIMLGQNDIQEKAFQQAQEVWAKILDQAITNFNPCITKNEDLVELLNILDRAIGLGIEGSAEGARFDAVLQKIGQYIQLHFVDNPWPKLIPEIKGRAPSCVFAELEARLGLPGCMEPAEVERIPLKFVVSSADPEELEELYLSKEEKAYHFVEGKGHVYAEAECVGFTVTLDGDVNVEGSYEGLPPDVILHLRWPISGLLKFYCPILTEGAQCLDPIGVDPQLELNLEFPLVEGAREEIGGWEFILHLVEP
jgi:hypothetical protein